MTKDDDDDTVPVMTISYDKVGDVQEILKIVSGYINEIGKLNSVKNSDEVKKLLQDCEGGIEKFQKAMERFVDGPEIYPVLKAGEKHLQKIDGYLEELAAFLDKAEKEGAKELKIDTATCPAIKGIENQFRELMKWADILSDAYCAHGFNIKTSRPR